MPEKLSGWHLAVKCAVCIAYTPYFSICSEVYDMHSTFELLTEKVLINFGRTYLLYISQEIK